MKAVCAVLRTYARERRKAKKEQRIPRCEYHQVDRLRTIIFTILPQTSRKSAYRIHPLRLAGAQLPTIVLD